MQFESLGHLKKLMHRAQLDAANATLPRVVRSSPVDQGLYKLGWEVVETLIGKEVQLRNDAPHAGIIELGARPFWPPFAPLYEWAKRKAGELHLAGLVSIGPQAFRKTKAGTLRYKGQAALNADDDKAIQSFARGVQHAIAKRGLPPRYIMAKQLPFAAKALHRAIVEYVEKVASGQGGTT